MSFAERVCENTAGEGDRLTSQSSTFPGNIPSRSLMSPVSVSLVEAVVASDANLPRGVAHGGRLQEVPDDAPAVT